MALGYRLWGYLLPFPMWFAEYFMRTAMWEPGANDFFPSSLAGAALGMLIPLMSPKKKREQGDSRAVESIQCEHLRFVAALALFLGTFAWLLTVYLSIGGSWPEGWIGAAVDWKLWIAIALYLLALLLSEWREKV